MRRLLLPNDIECAGEHFAILGTEPDGSRLWVHAHTYDGLTVHVCVVRAASDRGGVGAQLARSAARIRKAKALAACVGPLT